jgi:NNP family nitrate/nitrite transporter-like MFS transporter
VLRLHRLLRRLDDLSIIGIQIKKDLGLSETQFGLLVGTPILTGSLIRLFLGIWTDQYGGRRRQPAVMLRPPWRPGC